MNTYPASEKYASFIAILRLKQIRTSFYKISSIFYLQKVQIKVQNKLLGPKFSIWWVCPKVMAPK